MSPGPRLGRAQQVAGGARVGQSGAAMGPKGVGRGCLASRFGLLRPAKWRHDLAVVPSYWVLKHAPGMTQQKRVDGPDQASGIGTIFLGLEAALNIKLEQHHRTDRIVIYLHGRGERLQAAVCV
ncbi:hypothetical protein H112_06156 [Trichophyton rubrum D6]|uniref:Uncharacterized protein n=2 Tax=Trichophyton TaxID=5550 RepID=A0A022VWN0_TRIRU|nr:hypothetical protein H102_06139 [Trichophyton rubrum CBS 100081]EZF50466.1 hypothetical protein H103_06163 [Trichophyton rubrum CBS 288.86]EZF61059.1 hypothetical protein H104_06151 [Trichophyton rubrum CBS 289.86]EZF71732.1 hypothetical protein H105_06176 [Trichophyton soudanense CBS 452.61]EZF82529.1 hypothetical protein H110_06159 [Trichophyton rubrum MR1448]EZF93211.1 hypothetical protein H113_06205 [Trichophyton rubrum MR1459]EZG14557.1 hypothetical protein H107_06302 [Trichophyton ru